MARLNEPGGIGGGGGGGGSSADSIESLKRRFLRQNREIAKANSAQSLRIRKLEYDLSKTLTENMMLREKVLELEARLEKEERARQVLGSVADKKREMERLVGEMSALLGGMSLEVGRAERRKSQRSSSEEGRKTKEEREAEYAELREQGYQLPIIPEDHVGTRKSFTLGEFPRLSPTQDLDKSDQAFIEEEEEEGEVEFIQPPATIDTRPRRRRDSFRFDSPEDIHTDEPVASPIAVEEPIPTLQVKKSGSTTTKRKFEDLPSGDHDGPRVSGEFNFHNKKDSKTNSFSFSSSDPSALTSENFTDDPPIEATIVPAPKRRPPITVLDTTTLAPLSTPTTVARKALGPKTSNLSPRKPAALTKAKSDSALEKPLKAAANALKESMADLKPPSTPTQNHDETARPRRSRATAQVNYALPSLRGKLRRDTEELVDAVTGEKKGLFLFQAGGGSAGTTPSSSTRVSRVKMEREDLDEVGRKLEEIPERGDNDDGVAGDEVRGREKRKSITELSIEAARERRRKRLSQGYSAGMTAEEKKVAAANAVAAAERKRRQTLGTGDSDSEAPPPLLRSTGAAGRRRSTAV